MKTREATIIAQFESKAQEFQRQNPRLSYAVCYERALLADPDGYDAYLDAREWRRYSRAGLER